MRIYRTCWTLLVHLIAGASLVVGCLRESPVLILTQVVSVGVTGLALGACWEEDPARRWGTGRVWARRGVLGAMVLTGLPYLIGSWSLLVLGTIAATSPVVVLAAVQRRASRPTPSDERDLSVLPADELGRRWRLSSLAVHSSWRTPAQVLAVVEERQRLLDELELRDPEAFARWLQAAGWRESPSR